MENPKVRRGYERHGHAHAHPSVAHSKADRGNKLSMHGHDCITTSARVDSLQIRGVGSALASLVAETFADVVSRAGWAEIPAQ
jgi:hypothetical protein